MTSFVRLSLLSSAFATLLATAAAAPEFDDEDDDDWARAEEASQLKAPRPRSSAGGEPSARQYSLGDVELRHIYREAIILGALLAYLISWLINRQKYKRIADEWFNITKDTWIRNFSLVGTTYSPGLIRQGPRDYLLYLSGRAHVRSVYTNITIAARNDPVQMILGLFFESIPYDTAAFTARLPSAESDSQVFGIFLKKLVPRVMRTRWDFRELPKKRDMASTAGRLPSEEYAVFAEAPEFLATLWAEPEIREIFWASVGLDSEGKGTPFDEPLIESVLLSDMPTEEPYKLEDLTSQPKTLTVTYRFPDLTKLDDKQRQAIAKVAELPVILLDYIGQQGKLSVDGKAKIAKVRQAASQKILRAAEAERKEELARQKLQEKRARDEQVTSRTPEEQRKYEERERKKDLAKSQKKKMKKGKMTL
ncbi:uncharacterized protein EV422DRAFT_563175 [Fimicolochytrium jonesii]|uniref:uncharacterized protein n=1 Tax=Fimicolochytrium jonesii TaxID=1396493 RepID=UPI0022FE1F43|nr:uncharacterized protein EV422DRAFT_563175 [Fimicolochytrium jonesii]KAI8827097.1 hypothetical protein EV422DRAFT_563175 [Fimicolochytrium jonesii]